MHPLTSASKFGIQKRKRKRKLMPHLVTLPPTIHQISSLVFFLSIVSLASVATCRPTAKDGVDLVQEEKNLPSSDFLLSPNGELIEEPPQPLESGFGSIESPLLPPIDTAFSFNSDLVGPVSPPFTLFDSSSSSSFPSQIADDTLCRGENRHAFCCRPGKCVQTYRCYGEEVLNCCTVDPGDKDGENPYGCQPVSSTSPQGLQYLPGFPSDFDNGFDSGFKDFSSKFPGDSPPVDTFQELEGLY